MSVARRSTRTTRGTKRKKDQQLGASRTTKKRRKEPFSKWKLGSFYKNYETEENAIGPSGMLRLCNDLGVDPEDAVMLVIAFHLNSTRVGYFSKPDFIAGFTKLNIDSMEKLKASLDTLKAEVQTRLEELYYFSFEFSKEDLQAKVIKLDIAVAILGLLLGNYPHTEDIINFLNNQTSYKVINSDQWRMFLAFNRTVKKDFQGYSEDGAWPVIIDEFVDHMKMKDTSKMDIG